MPRKQYRKPLCLPVKMPRDRVDALFDQCSWPSHHPKRWSDSAMRGLIRILKVRNARKIYELQGIPFPGGECRVGRKAQA